MKIRKLFLAAVCLGLISGAANLAFASGVGRSEQGAAPAASTDMTKPSYDMKAQSIVDLQGLQKKYVALAGAIPADKFTWRPGDGARSTAELFLHVTVANYTIPNMMGTPVPAGLDAKGLEKSTTDKAKIVEGLNKSFDSAIAAVQGMTNADFAKPETKLGPEANDGDVVYILVTHAHEHLGQAIAYARVAGVVPPWTADAMKKKADKAPQE
jgi:uncharacterized damage-inducible protein DinB